MVTAKIVYDNVTVILFIALGITKNLSVPKLKFSCIIHVHILTCTPSARQSVGKLPRQVLGKQSTVRLHNRGGCVFHVVCTKEQ